MLRARIAGKARCFRNAWKNLSPAALARSSLLHQMRKYLSAAEGAGCEQRLRHALDCAVVLDNQGARSLPERLFPLSLPARGPRPVPLPCAVAAVADVVVREQQALSLTASHRFKDQRRGQTAARLVTPIRVHAPGAADPIFRYRDYGAGGAAPSSRVCFDLNQATPVQCMRLFVDDFIHVPVSKDRAKSSGPRCQ